MKTTTDWLNEGLTPEEYLDIADTMTVNTPEWTAVVEASQKIEWVESGESMVGESGMGGYTWEAWETYFRETGLDQTGYDWMSHYSAILEQGGTEAYDLTQQLYDRLDPIQKEIDARILAEKTGDSLLEDVGGFVGETFELVTDIADNIITESAELAVSTQITGVPMDVATTIGSEISETLGMEEITSAIDQFSEDFDDVFDQSFDDFTADLLEAVGIDAIAMNTIGVPGVATAEFLAETGTDVIEGLNTAIESAVDTILGTGGVEGVPIPEIDLSDITLAPEGQKYGRRQTIVSELPKTFEEKKFTGQFSLDTDVGEALL